MTGTGIGIGASARPVRPFVDFELVLEPDAWSADVAVIGVTHSEPYAGDEQPNDQTRAPDAIRAQSGQFGFGDGRHYDFDFGGALHDLLPARRIDCGNRVRGTETIDEYFASVTAALGLLWRTGAQVFVLGGDHGVTIPAIDALAVLGEPLHLVHIDAHLDWRAEVGGVRRGYSSPLYWASTRPWISGMTQIGLRGTGSARRAEVEAARAWGSRLVTAAEVHEAGWQSVLDIVPRDRPLYVTVDADGLDPSTMPAVMAPAPGGLRFDEVAGLLGALAGRQPIAGMDLVELAPRYDASNAISTITAGRLLLTVMGRSRRSQGVAYIQHIDPIGLLNDSSVASHN
jgi:agmatinase